jgi:hypothetical protein
MTSMPTKSGCRLPSVPVRTSASPQGLRADGPRFPTVQAQSSLVAPANAQLAACDRSGHWLLNCEGLHSVWNCHPDDAALDSSLVLLSFGSAAWAPTVAVVLLGLVVAPLQAVFRALFAAYVPPALVAEPSASTLLPADRQPRSNRWSLASLRPLPARLLHCWLCCCRSLLVCGCYGACRQRPDAVSVRGASSSAQ